MIISNIIGGLGNQMFQYAVARALCLQKKVPLKLDLSGYSENTAHNGFELDRVFNINTEQASNNDFYQVLGWKSLKVIRRLMKSPKGEFLRSKRFIKEPELSYWPGIESIPDSCYLMGYWQSEKYFSEFSDVIKSDFSFRGILENKNREIARRIGKYNSVSIHVRRGDYLLHTKTTYHKCSEKYYERAISYIAKKVKEPVFFIFSDDPKWVESNFDIEFPFEIIGNNPSGGSYNDMRLMSLCKHHIIANSSFSWWGARLSETEKKNKIATAPKFWFRNHSHNPAKDRFKLINNVE